MKLSEFATTNNLSNSQAAQLLSRAGFPGKVHSSNLSEAELRAAKKQVKNERPGPRKGSRPRRAAVSTEPMTTKEMAESLSRRFKVTISPEQVGLAARVPDPLEDSAVVEVPQDAVVLALMSEGILPEEAIEQLSSAATSAFRRTPGTSLVLVRPESRPKSRVDEDNLEWMRAVIAADEAIKAEEKAGNPYRPKYVISASQRGVVYPDPLSEFLELEQFSPHVPRGKKVNEIYVPLEKIELFAANPSQSFQWRSRELLNEFQRRFLSLWCVRTKCGQCGMEMGGIITEVKQLLRGERYLPDTPDVNPMLIYMGSVYHPWCLSIRAELLQLRVALQSMEGDSEEAQALRAVTYVDMIHRVTYKHEEDGATTDLVIAAFRAYLRNLKEMIANAGH